MRRVHVYLATASWYVVSAVAKLFPLLFTTGFTRRNMASNRGHDNRNIQVTKVDPHSNPGVERVHHGWFCCHKEAIGEVIMGRIHVEADGTNKE